MDAPVLYHLPPSFYSQVARLALAEGGVTYTAQVAAAGPPIFETYEPWYMRLNSGGTVPTLVDGDNVLDDSMDIVRYVNDTYCDGALMPPENSEIARWVARLEGLSFRNLSYGGSMAKMGFRVNGWRLRNLRKRLARHPDLATQYLAKIADIEGFRHQALDAARLQRLRSEVVAILDAMEAALSDRPWLAGAEYTLADLVWTVGVARFLMLDLDPFRGRPSLYAWYERVKARPSFLAADVWESMQLQRMLPVVARKVLPRLAPVLVLVGVLMGLLLLLVRVSRSTTTEAE